MLTEYQMGSIFGTVLISVAFAAAFSVQRPYYPENGKDGCINAKFLGPDV
jgi:hypothetical protein